MNPEPEFHSEIDLEVMLSILNNEEFLKFAGRYRGRILLHPRMCTSIAREAIRRGFAVHPRDLIPAKITITDFGSRSVGGGNSPVSGT